MIEMVTKWHDIFNFVILMTNYCVSLFGLFFVVVGYNKKEKRENDLG